ncbi:MAG: PAS domain S-box protein [Rhodocyclaceae bacterium]|nr:PAS domain S-box protein [Rhodocyclaceae bacterium]
MTRTSLRFRINALVTALVLVFFALTAVLMLQDIRRQIREEMEATSRVTMQLLSTVVYSTQFVPTAMNRADMVRGFLDSVGRIRAHEVVMFGEEGNGVELYHSPPSRYKAGRKAPDWFGELVGPETRVLKLAAPGLRLVVTPDASRAILDAWDDVLHLVWLAAGFFVLANLLVYWIIGRALQPVSTLLRGLERMAAGDLGARVEGIDTSELRALGDGFNRMAEALERSLRENETLALAMRQASDAILLMDPAGRVRLWNPAAERLFGYPPEAMPGLDARQLAPEHLRGELETDLALLAEGKAVDPHDAVRRTRMGRSLEVSYRASPLVEPGTGEFIGSIVAYHDIAERRRAEAVSRELDASRQMAQVVQTHLEEERRALAMELHDELGQYVTAVKTIAQATANRTAESDPQTHASSLAIVSAAGQIYDAVHQIIRRLRPVALERFGLAETLRDSVSEWRKQYPDLDFRLDIGEDLGTISSEQQIALFRVAQECVTNVVKHAGATVVDIRLGTADGHVGLSVRDNGRGIPRERLEGSGRFGLLGMRDRVQALGGRLDISTGADSGSDAYTGTEVRARIPQHLELT